MINAFHESEIMHKNILAEDQILRNSETRLIDLVGEFNSRKYYLRFECSSIFEYTAKFLQFSERKTYDFISLYRKAKSIPELKREIEKSEIGYTKLKTILPVLEKNIKESPGAQRDEIELIITNAKTQSRRTLEKTVRDIVPLEGSSFINVPRYMGRGRVQRTANLLNEQEVLVDKAMRLLSEELKENISFETFLQIVSERFIDGKLKKGKKRALIVIDENGTVNTGSLGELEVKKENFETGFKKEDSAINTKEVSKKVEQAVVLREKDRCAKCSGIKNLELHHIKPLSQGGLNTTENLILLCKSCHSLVHRNYIEIKKENSAFKFEYYRSKIKTFTDVQFDKMRKHKKDVKNKKTQQLPIV